MLIPFVVIVSIFGGSIIGACCTIGGCSIMLVFVSLAAIEISSVFAATAAAAAVVDKLRLCLLLTGDETAAAADSYSPVLRRFFKKKKLILKCF